MESSYRKLALVVSINIVIMLFLTYVMISSAEHFVVNINRIYTALIMAAPMVIVMLLVMRSMFMNKRLNAILLATFGLITILLFILINPYANTGR